MIIGRRGSLSLSLAAGVVAFVVPFSQGSSATVSPSHALTRTTGGAVYVAHDGIARRTEIKIGGDNGSLVEILSGVKADDAVVLRSSTPVEDGMRVSIAQ